MNKQQKNLRISKEQFIEGIKKRAKFLREREGFLESKKPHTKLKPIELPEVEEEPVPEVILKEIENEI